MTTVMRWVLFITFLAVSPSRPDLDVQHVVSGVSGLPRRGRLSLDRVGSGWNAVRAGQRRRPLVDEPMAGPRDDDGLVVSGAVTLRSLTASHVSRAFARWASVT